MLGLGNTMTHEEMEALKKVVDYLWEDEARNYAETGNPHHHIFLQLEKLHTFIQKNITTELPSDATNWKEFM